VLADSNPNDSHQFGTKGHTKQWWISDDGNVTSDDGNVTSDDSDVMEAMTV